MNQIQICAADCYKKSKMLKVDCLNREYKKELPYLNNSKLGHWEFPKLNINIFWSVVSQIF